MTEAERKGDFSALLTAAKPVKLSDPVNPDCIVNNVIQPQCIDPHSKEVLNFMAPPPNLPGLIQNLSEATSSSSGFQRSASPRNGTSALASSSGFPSTLSTTFLP